MKLVSIGKSPRTGEEERLQVSGNQLPLASTALACTAALSEEQACGPVGRGHQRPASWKGLHPPLTLSRLTTSLALRGRQMDRVEIAQAPETQLGLNAYSSLGNLRNISELEVTER